MHRKILYFLLILSLFPALLMAGTKGRVRGEVKDLQTGEPLIGANVIVVGTSIGAATDANGEFVLLNLDAGTYQIRASYLGYQTVTISNVRVNADLTTYIDFELPDEEVSVGTVEIVATKPLVQKDATNAVRITSSEDIEALPVRGVQNIIGLSAGVVLKDNTVFIRGGRQDEVGYYLEGISVTDPLFGGNQVTVSQDAVEEIQVQAGGYNAEFGGANAGIIRQQLKSGGPQLKASIEYITDNITFKSKDDFNDGEERLGTHWYGYDELSASISGPLFDQRIKGFYNFNYRYFGDDDPQPYPGIDIGQIGDFTTGDTVNLLYPAGPVYNNQSQYYTHTGTVNLDFKPFLIRLTGTYTAQKGDGVKNWGNVAEFLNRRKSVEDITRGSFSAKLTHILSPNMYYELSGGMFIYDRERTDPALGADFWSYGDSVANANAGYIWTRTEQDIAAENVGRFEEPEPYNVMGFQFIRPGTISNSYLKREQRSFEIAGNLSLLVGKVHSFKIGGDYKQYTMRSWTMGRGGQVDLAFKENRDLGIDPNADVNELRKQYLITAGVNNYGYDIFGNEVEDDFFFGPHQPVFASAYIQDRIEFEDLILNLGIRYDYIDIDNLKLKDPSSPELGINANTGELIQDGWEETATYSDISPRIGFSFPVTDRTVFHAQFGKFIQQPQLSNMYQGYYRTSFEIRGGFFIPVPTGSDVRPTRTIQYELGFTQQLTDFMSFDITGYYKDVKDQVVFVNQTVNSNSPFQEYASLSNGDFATTKGIELSVNMRRYERLAMNGSISFQDARGTGSFPNSNRGIVGAPLDGVTVFTPQYVSPLEYNSAVNANLNFDYRFGPNDGPAFLNDFGVSVLMTYASGHPFTRGVGGADLEGDARNRRPVEPLNSSTTPSTFQMDLRVDKTFRLFDQLSANIYVHVINLFDAENIENVFLRTGSADDDGYITDPELAAQLIETYGDKYVELYKAVNLDYYEQFQAASATLYTNPNLFGPPRQIRLGIRLEY